MLFMQVITIKYDKRSRSGENMRRIRAIRFLPIPMQNADLTNGEYFLYDNRYQKAKVYPFTERFRVTERVFVTKVDETYQVLYSDRPADQHFKAVMMLHHNEYGRVVYHLRETTFDGEWIYCRTIINFFDTDESKLRTKLFFRKEPDHFFADMAYLRYCGDYGKDVSKNPF
ncbi:MAG TPA: hypothetical protein DCG49_11570 [Ruminococcus sp.]|nr:hypothetical protein [Ruminococcus sp.]